MSWKMKSYSIKIINGLLAVSFCLFSCSNSSRSGSRVANLPFYKDASFTPHWLQLGSDELSTFHSIPNFNFINQEGDTITEQIFDSKIYITDFFFTSCPGICPKMTANMALLQEAFLMDDKVLLLSHTVTPEIDSVSVLKNYADAKGVNSNKWHLVTGKRQDIYDLGRNYYFVEEDLGLLKTDDDFLHTENFVLIDQNKHIRGIYNGLNKTSVSQLIEDVKTLKNE